MVKSYLVIQMTKEWFISGNVPSLKNSKVITKFGLQHSKTVKKYLSSKGIQDYSPSNKTVKDYVKRPNIFRQEAYGLREELKKNEKPYKIGMYFVRDSTRKFDYINSSHIILDLMSAHCIIEDDNMDEVIPVFLGYHVDKNKPGVIIKIGGN